MRERNYGIDFLRILSMFMVVVLHVLGQGGVLDAAAPGSTNYWVAWFLEVAMYCAVDCFAMISGYALSVTNTKISSIVSLWVQTLFYSVSITVLFFLFFPEASISKTDILISCFPIITKRYWYMSAYFGMYIIVPILNTALLKVKKRTLEFVFIGMFFIFGGFSLKFDPFNLGEGCSVMWLSLLYLLGGYFRRYNIASKIKKYKGWILYVATTVLTFLSKYVIETFTNLPDRDEGYANLFISFVSPTVLMASVGLFVAVYRLEIPKPFVKIISFFTPAALGVYLIHTCGPIWTNVFKGFSENFVNYSPVKMVLFVIGSAIGIYFVCSAIELVRLYLFKILRINVLYSVIGDKARLIINKVCSKFSVDEDALQE